MLKFPAILAIMFVAVTSALTACGPAPEPVVVKETSIVVETVVVETEGKKVVQEVTRVVEVEVEVEREIFVTATPQPGPTEVGATEPPRRELEGLWYHLRTEPPTLDIQLAGDTTSFLIIDQCIEGLFEYRGDGSIEPTGATGYEVSDDGLVYTIHLRDDALWSDGEPVVAQHFVDGVMRLLDPDAAAGYGWLIYHIEGAEAFNTEEGVDPATVGVRALDETTLEIRLREPTAYCETVLPFSTFYPVRLDAIEEHGDAWTEPGNYLCNGPYLLDYWEHEAEVGLVRNPAYWDADNVSIERITLPIIQEDATAVAMFETDQLHVSRYPAEDVPRILADPVLSQELAVLPRPGVGYLGLNSLRPPTDDPLVRKALASAIDRKTLVEEVLLQPWFTPLSCTTPPNIMGHQEWGTCGHTFDPAQAQAYLAQAGYPDGEGFPVLSVWHTRTQAVVDMLEAIAALWEEHLGISVELRTNEWAVYLDLLDACGLSAEALADCEFNAYQLAWVMDYGDPQNQLEVVFSPASPFQNTGWENDRYEELMELARSETDTDLRASYYMEADRILCEDEAVIIPITGMARSTLVKTGVVYEFPPFGGPYFKYWALE